jgi:hypothetical protein
MLSIGGDAGEDLVRLFFRTQVCHRIPVQIELPTHMCNQIGNIEVIFEELQKVAENITASFDLGAGGIAVVSESTRILLVCLFLDSVLMIAQCEILRTCGSRDRDIDTRKLRYTGLMIPSYWFRFGQGSLVKSKWLNFS